MLILIVLIVLSGAFITRRTEQAESQLVAALQTATRLADLLSVTISTPTPYIMHTLPPAWTATHTALPTSTFTPSDTTTATFTPTATATYTFTATPTFTPTSTPTITATFTPSPVISPTPTRPAPAGAPAPVSPAYTGEDDLFNILLIGSDKRPADPTYRTDTLIIVSINRTRHTVALLSIPRDLYVYIPRWGKDRINAAAEYGDFMKWPGRGNDLLINTIGYNLGISIQRYARINFDGFKKIVDQVDGIDVAVDCPLSDYHLKSPLLKEGVEANYAWYTLPIGMHHMNGALALWYARSRETTSDYDRGRRQQIVLRAIWHKALEKDMIAHLPDLWGQLTAFVDTNLNLGDVLSLLPLTAELDAAHLRSYAIGPNQVTPWTTDDGAQVLLPRPAAIRALLQQFFTPPTDNRLFAEQPLVEVYNASAHADWDQVASARLAWEGFEVDDLGKLDSDDPKHTMLYDYTGKAKPGSLNTLLRLFSVRRANVINAPDPDRTADFRIVIGDDYTACTPS